MISLTEHRTGLQNLGTTIDALETLNDLIEYYSINAAGPAYLQIRHCMGEPAIQLDRSIMVEALDDQRQRLVDYLATLGIDANG